MVDPQAKAGFEVFLAIGQIFGAFVLALSPIQPVQARLSWVAIGFLTLGLGAIGYGYVLPSFFDAADLSVGMYGSIYVRTVGSAFFMLGLVLPRTRRVSVWNVTIGVTILVAVGLALTLAVNHLPALIHLPRSSVDEGAATLADLEVALSTGHAVFPGLTPWYFVLAYIPLVACAVAVWSAIQKSMRAEGIGLWLVLALTLMAGVQLHSIFWPPMFSSVFSTTSVLRFVVVVVVVVIVGGILELRSVIHHRDALLHAEQERVQQLEDVAQLKADFTAIVAHEFANPIAAIRTMAHVVAVDDLPEEMRLRMAQEIEGEARVLEMLVDDMQDSEAVERSDFRIVVRPLAVDDLVGEAVSYARSLSVTHEFRVEHAARTKVSGDPYRLGQVLRNLLNNAARYTPPGTTIVLSTRYVHEAVVIAVVDNGPGISPEDIGHIFEKFARGNGAADRHVGGLGLGLYLSRSIIRRHGSELIVDSAPGKGASFSFRLRQLP